MNAKEKCAEGGCADTKERFEVQLTAPVLYDRLNMLSAEYSVSVELLVNAAVKRLIDDVEFVRSLRAGTIEHR